MLTLSYQFIIIEHLLQQWNAFESTFSGTAILPSPPMSPHHIRVRDGGKSTTASTIATNTAVGGGGGGSLLRDDRVLCRCLLGLAGRSQLLPPNSFQTDLIYSL